MTRKDQTHKPEIPRPSAEQIEQALAGVQPADDVVAALKGLVGYCALDIIQHLRCRVSTARGGIQETVGTQWLR